MEGEVKSTDSNAKPVPRPRLRWLWFAGGFLLVFVGLLLLVDVTAMHPSGPYVVRYQLWRYCLANPLRSSGRSTLGPGSGGTSQFVETALVHLVLSAAGGGAATALGWGAGRWLGR